MQKIFAVIRREYTERVRTKAFIFSTLLLPALIAFMAVVPALLMRGGDRTSRVAMVDGTTTGVGEQALVALTSQKLSDKPDAAPRYDITRSVTHPDWAHEVLVEGLPSAEGPEACGAAVLEPLSVSILPGACAPRMIPAETLPGRKFVLPKTNLAPLFAERPAPPGPYATRDFTLLFDFDSAFLTDQHDDYWLDQAATWALAARPAEIIVTGYAAVAQATVSGRALSEDPAIAGARAGDVAEALARMGLPKDRIAMRTDVAPAMKPELAAGLPEASQRRVTITLRIASEHPAQD